MKVCLTLGIITENCGTLLNVGGSDESTVEIVVYSSFRTFERTCLIFGGSVALKHIPCHPAFFFGGRARRIVRMSGKNPNMLLIVDTAVKYDVTNRLQALRQPRPESTSAKIQILLELAVHSSNHLTVLAWQLEFLDHLSRTFSSWSHAHFRQKRYVLEPVYDI